MDQDTDQDTDQETTDRTLRTLPLLDRRRALTLFGGAGLAVLAGCGSGGGTDDAASSSSTSTASTTAGAAAGGSCEPIPEETAGPFPGDGSNGPDVLGQDGVVRSDIRSSFGAASGVAEGVPLTVDLTVLDSADGCAPVSGGAVYIWHCDRDGQYSMYSDGVSEENYLRGVQETGVDGKVSFTSIFPAAYSGRWPHIHFEVYASVADATGGGEKLVISQLAFPEDVCEHVYTTADGYTLSESNLEQTSLDTDMVFSDGYSTQLATVTGSVDDGYVAALSVMV